MSRFVYYNINPDGNRESDCVTRAITFATGIDYPEIRKKLFHTSRLLNCEKLCVACYRHLIEDVLQCKEVECRGLTINEFIDRHPYGTYLIRISGHITVVKDGKCYDIWNCLDEFCDVAWKVS